MINNMSNINDFSMDKLINGCEDYDIKIKDVKMLDEYLQTLGFDFDPGDEDEYEHDDEGMIGPRGLYTYSDSGECIEIMYEYYDRGYTVDFGDGSGRYISSKSKLTAAGVINFLEDLLA